MKDLKSTDAVPVTRSPGRPRTVCADNQPSSTVTAYLPAAYHDRLVKLAQLNDQSVSATVRQLLILRLT